MVATHREELGPYLIYDRIGVGGMATVDRAVERGIEGVDRMVALKRLLPHLTSDELIVRGFVREARLGSLLQHANIVQTYTFGRVGTMYFIALEYVEGCHLRQILRHAHVAGPPPIPVTVAIIRQICDGLDYAHQRRDIEGRPLGLVHRDVSPANLLVTRSGHLKIIHFGIAQSLNARPSTRRIEGKLAYMSPEALAGEPLDQRSDLFSLGVVFHELLTARPLFPRSSEPNVERETIQPPTAMRDEIPAALDAIVMRALETDPGNRWSSAAELRAALLAASPATAGPSEIAAWCAPVFAADASGPIQLPDEREVTASDSGPGIVLDDVPDYAELSVSPGTAPGVAPLAASKWRHVETIETHVVPPSASRPSAALAPRAATPISQPPGTRLRDTPAREAPPAPAPARPARAPARVDLRLVVGAAIGIVAIGLTIGLLERRGAKRAPAAAADPPVPPPAPVSAAAEGTVTIDTAPGDATIAIGDRPPHTGSPWTLALAPGSYPIAISARDHDRWTTTLVVRAGGSHLVRAALASNKPPPLASAILAIDSTPPGLEVILDGAPLANRTPLRMGVVPGAHTIVVRNAGTDMWTTEFTAKDNHSHRFTAAPREARPPPPATPDASVPEPAAPPPLDDPPPPPP